MLLAASQAAGADSHHGDEPGSPETAVLDGDSALQGSRARSWKVQSRARLLKLRRHAAVACRRRSDTHR